MSAKKTGFVIMFLFVVSWATVAQSAQEDFNAPLSGGSRSSSEMQLIAEKSAELAAAENEYESASTVERTMKNTAIVSALGGAVGGALFGYNALNHYNQYNAAVTTDAAVLHREKTYQYTNLSAGVAVGGLVSGFVMYFLVPKILDLSLTIERSDADVKRLTRELEELRDGSN
jgi:hypothetical protein